MNFYKICDGKNIFQWHLLLICINKKNGGARGRGRPPVRLTGWPGARFRRAPPKRAAAAAAGPKGLSATKEAEPFCPAKDVQFRKGQMVPNGNHGHRGCNCCERGTIVLPGYPFHGLKTPFFERGTKKIFGRWSGPSGRGTRTRRGPIKRITSNL